MLDHNGGVIWNKWCLACISGIGIFDRSIDESDFISRKARTAGRTIIRRTGNENGRKYVYNKIVR